MWRKGICSAEETVFQQRLSVATHSAVPSTAQGGDGAGYCSVTGDDKRIAAKMLSIVLPPPSSARLTRSMRRRGCPVRHPCPALWTAPSSSELPYSRRPMLLSSAACAVGWGLVPGVPRPDCHHRDQGGEDPGI